MHAHTHTHLSPHAHSYKLQFEFTVSFGHKIHSYSAKILRLQTPILIVLENVIMFYEKYVLCKKRNTNSNTCAWIFVLTWTSYFKQQRTIGTHEMFFIIGKVWKGFTLIFSFPIQIVSDQNQKRLSHIYLLDPSLILNTFLPIHSLWLHVKRLFDHRTIGVKQVEDIPKTFSCMLGHDWKAICFAC